MRWILGAPERWGGRADVVLLALRVALAVVFIAHGGQKLFGIFGGPGIPGTVTFFESLGLRPGLPLAYLSGIAEFGGALLLAAGIMTPIAAVGIMLDMLVAIVFRTWAQGFYGQFEFNIVIISAAITLLLMGAGRLSLDNALLAGRREPAEAGPRIGAAARA